MNLFHKKNVFPLNAGKGKLFQTKSSS